MRRKKRRNLEERNQEVKSVAYTFNPCPARQRSHVLLFMLQMSNIQLLLDFALLATLSIFLWCIKGTARANIRKLTVTSYNTSSEWQGAKEEDW